MEFYECLEEMINLTAAKANGILTAESVSKGMIRVLKKYTKTAEQREASRFIQWYDKDMKYHKIIDILNKYNEERY